MIETVWIKPSDLLLLQTKGNLTFEQVKELKERAVAGFEHERIVILPFATEVTIIRKQEDEQEETSIE